MTGHIDAWRSGHGDEYGSDERLIAEPFGRRSARQPSSTRSSGNRYGHGGVIQPFPTRRAEGLRFIGERIYEDNQPNGDDRDYYVVARMSLTGHSCSMP